MPKVIKSGSAAPQEPPPAGLVASTKVVCPCSAIIEVPGAMIVTLDCKAGKVSFAQRVTCCACGKTYPAETAFDIHFQDADPPPKYDVRGARVAVIGDGARITGGIRF